MYSIKPIKMRYFREHHSEGEPAYQVGNSGCVFLSTMVWASQFTDISYEKIEDLVENIDESILTPGMRVQNFEKLLQEVGVVAKTRVFTTQPDFDCQALCFVKKHCFLATIKDGIVSLYDPGYYGDTKIDDEGFCVNDKGKRSHDPDGNPRTPSSWRVLDFVENC
jgi:hypothetical protein